MFASRQVIPQDIAIVPEFLDELVRQIQFRPPSPAARQCGKPQQTGLSDQVAVVAVAVSDLPGLPNCLCPSATPGRCGTDDSAEKPPLLGRIPLPSHRLANKPVPHGSTTLSVYPALTCRAKISPADREQTELQGRAEARRNAVCWE